MLGNDSATNGEAARPATRPGNGAPHRRRGRWGHIYAALDLGTNNCRLLIARPYRGGFQVIDAFSRIVRLGEGLAATGRLSEVAMDRAVAALAVCAAKMRRRGVTRARCIATEACRKAVNCADFLARVRAETGLELEIISSGEEARLAVAGCTPLIDRDARHALVFDIGGGSTELMWLRLRRPDRRELVAWTSLPCGVVTLAESHGGMEVPFEIYEAMVHEVGERLAGFEREHRLGGAFTHGQVQMLGTSGTVTTLAGVHLDLPRYDRNRVDGVWLSFRDALAVSERLRAMSYHERAAHPCIGYERADLVVAGCAILEAIRRTWPAERLRVADRGLREGVLMSLMREADRERSRPVAGRGPS